MSVKALRTQLLGAIAMVLVATLALGSSTFAWFSLNSTVTVTGMNVKTEVKNNLLIAPGTLADAAKPNDNAFTTSLVTSLGDKLIQPSSTIDGKTYFYASKTNVAGSGDHIATSFIEYNTPGTSETPTSAQLSSFNENAGYTANDSVGFVDYVFYLKAQNTGNTAADIKVTDINLFYGGNQDKADTTTLVEKAFRVALLVEDVTENAPTANKSGALKTILMCEAGTGTRYFHQDGSNNSQAVQSTTALGNVNNLSTSAVLASVDATSTKYYKVVARLWLEGEDVTCNNSTFMDLKDKWALDLTIELAGDNAAKTLFDTWDANTKVDLTVGGVTVGTTAVVIDNVSYYPISGATVAYNGSTSVAIYSSTASSITSSSRIFVIVDGHPFEVTTLCTLPTTP